MAEKGFSHVYILMTFMPEIISFIKRTLSSVILAVFDRNSECFFPNQTEMEKIVLQLLYSYRIYGGIWY